MTPEHQQPLNLEPSLPPEWEPEGIKEPEGKLSVMSRQEIPLSVEAATLASHMGRIQARLTVEMERLEQAGNAIAQVVNSIEPKDQTTYTELCERLNDCKKFNDGVEEWADPWRTLFYRPYKAVLERVTTITLNSIIAYKRGKTRIIEFDREVKAAADRETLRLKKEQQDREAQQRLDAAVKAEDMGLSEQAVETILTQPSTAPTPIAAPAISRPQGFRKIPPNWQAELEDKAAFWAWAKRQREMPAMLLIDAPTMNREAKTLKATLGQKYPGFRGVNKGGE